MEHHHGLGMGVRNLLREGGFEWGPIELDELWVRLVERAARKNKEMKLSAEKERFIIPCPIL
jgi:hypothetical protein